MSVTKQRVLSGMRPTGKLHLGHLVGALQNWVELQAKYDSYHCIVDWHALTTNYADTSEIVANGIDNAADWIGSGLDPEKSTFFVQSLVPEHAELYLLFQMVTPISWLERVPTYKEQMEQLSERDLSSIGFLGYPLLQAADIVVYDAHWVPVGEDQVPHIELTREVVRRFNNFYPSSALVEPQALLTPTPRLPGLDNRKMSKSYNNTIDLSDDAKSVQNKVRQMYTDPKRVRADIPGTVEGNPVFMYHDAFNPNVAEVADLKERYRAGKVGDVEVKTKLAAAINTMLDPIRERRAQALARPGYVREVLMEGSKKARIVAQATMDRVRDAVKLKY
jgi:tryptophanyl-tRNA synthetase